MPTKKRTTASKRVDPDDAPPLDRDWFERAEIRQGCRCTEPPFCARPTRRRDLSLILVSQPKGAIQVSLMHCHRNSRQPARFRLLRHRSPPAKPLPWAHARKGRHIWERQCASFETRDRRAKLLSKWALRRSRRPLAASVTDRLCEIARFAHAQMAVLRLPGLRVGRLPQK
jgi:hypothetical protein